MQLAIFVVLILCFVLISLAVFARVLENLERDKRKKNPIFNTKPERWTPIAPFQDDTQRDLFLDVPQDHIKMVNRTTYISEQAYVYVFQKGKSYR